MKILTVVNGVLSIALVPETEMEEIILRDISKGEVNIQVYDKLQIMDKALQNVTVISPKSNQ